MRTTILACTMLYTTISGFNQVGVGTATPLATLEISAMSITSPMPSSDSLVHLNDKRKKQHSTNCSQ
ncbi:MAG: hypothetical protein ACWA5P_00830 [bacterium]